jgi:lysylphosphatidylglycerol synthetase-like protein (DUF2156 family)
MKTVQVLPFSKEPELYLVPNSRAATAAAADVFCLDECEFEVNLKALKLWGRNTHSFSSVGSDVEHFRVKGVRGYIPLVRSKGFLLISGEPVGDASATQALIAALKNFANTQMCSIGSLPVSHSGREALERAGFGSVYIGKEPIIELQNLPRFSKSVRQSAQRATRRGLKVIAYNDQYRSQIEDLCKNWQNRTEMPAMGFLFRLDPFQFKEFKKYFLVIDECNNLKAFLACSPIYGRNGWYLEDLIRDHLAPNGCTELLVTEAVKSLADEGYAMATLALAPLAGLPDKDETHPILNQILRLCYDYLSFIYHFKTLEYFKAKFHPSYWEKNYFCYYAYADDTLWSLVGKLLCSFMPKDIPAIIKHKLGKWRLTG